MEIEEIHVGVFVSLDKPCKLSLAEIEHKADTLENDNKSLEKQKMLTEMDKIKIE